MTPAREALANAAIQLLERFEERNQEAIDSNYQLRIYLDLEPSTFGSSRLCGLYQRRDSAATIQVWAPRCSSAGVYSYPGYTSDRTVYGVVAHEYGHHLDSCWEYSRSLSRLGEAPISSYHPNRAEYFAEMARVFLTNPDLLRVLRPRCYTFLSRLWAPAEDRTWQQVLDGAPRSIQSAVDRKIWEATKLSK